MGDEIRRSDALLALLNTLYEQYRDDLPPSLRLLANLLRKLAANMTGSEVRAIQSATSDDFEEAFQQSKFATEYAAQSWLNTTAIAKALDELRTGDLAALAEQIDQLQGSIAQRNATDIDAEASRRIERAKECRDQLKIPEARAHLEIARRELWSQMSGHNRYRILAELGLCDMFDDHRQSAAKLWLEAKRHDPDNPKALALEAYALFIFGETEKARSIADDLLQSNPSQDLAAQVWVVTSPRDLSFDAIESHLLPAVRAEFGVANTLAARAANDGLYDKAIEYVRIALAARPNDIDVRSRAAQVFFTIVAENDKHIRTSCPLPDPQGLLNEATAHIYHDRTPSSTPRIVGGFASTGQRGHSTTVAVDHWASVRPPRAGRV